MKISFFHIPLHFLVITSYSIHYTKLYDGLHAQEGYYNTVFQAGGSIVTDDKKSGYALPETEVV